MADNRDAAGRSPLQTGLDTGEFDRTDRILLGACAAVWLAALGAGVAATVALVDLGTGHAQSTGESETPWLLYAVIAISAAVIIGAVPLLLRARRAALEESPPPPPPATEAPPPPTTTRSGPRQVTYSVTGTKAPGDIITVTYVDASGRSRTQRNVYIPWSLTVTPISNSEVGSVQASSLFLVSRLNCSITTSDGTVLSSNTNNAAQTSC